MKRELFKEGIISKFEDELREQNLKIEELESKIHSQENAFKKLDIYGRRTCFHIHVILFKEGDDDDVMEAIEKYCNVIDIPFNENEIDRTYGIGKPFLNKQRKKKVRAIIVKFKSSKALHFIKLDQKIM